MINRGRGFRQNRIGRRDGDRLFCRVSDIAGRALVEPTGAERWRVIGHYCMGAVGVQDRGAQLFQRACVATPYPVAVRRVRVNLVTVDHALGWQRAPLPVWPDIAAGRHGLPFARHLAGAAHPGLRILALLRAEAGKAAGSPMVTDEPQRVEIGTDPAPVHQDRHRLPPHIASRRHPRSPDVGRIAVPVAIPVRQHHRTRLNCARGHAGDCDRQPPCVRCRLCKKAAKNAELLLSVFYLSRDED